jgi:hypothetical protein
VVFSQNSIEPEAKNTISISGSDLFLVGSASINYERFFYKNDQIKLFLSAGYGKWYYVGD